MIRISNVTTCGPCDSGNTLEAFIVKNKRFKYGSRNYISTLKKKIGICVYQESIRRFVFLFFFFFNDYQWPTGTNTQLFRRCFNLLGDFIGRWINSWLLILGVFDWANR